jgi:hypothetical protein
MNPLNCGLLRRRSRVRFALGFSLVFIHAVALAAVQPPKHAPAEEKKPKPDAKTGLHKLKVKELIDKLQEVSDDPVVWGIDFVATDEQLEFRKAINGPHKLKTSPVIKELVHRGVAALPELIAHLEDKRPTKLVIFHKGFGGMWQSDEYDPRYSDPKKKPEGVNTGLEKEEGIEKQKPPERAYTIRVAICALLPLVRS